jgi:hypothetical protein
VSKVVDAVFNVVTEANSVGLTYLGASMVAGNSSKLPGVLNQSMTLPTYSLFQQYSTSFAEDLKALRPNIQCVLALFQLWNDRKLFWQATISDPSNIWQHQRFALQASAARWRGMLSGYMSP